MIPATLLPIFNLRAVAVPRFKPKSIPDMQEPDDLHDFDEFPFPWSEVDEKAIEIYFEDLEDIACVIPNELYNEVIG